MDGPDYENLIIKSGEDEGPQKAAEDKQRPDDDKNKAFPGPVPANPGPPTEQTTFHSLTANVAEQGPKSSSRIIPSIKDGPYEGGSTPKVLVWRNLKVSVPQQTGRLFKRSSNYRQVLDNVSGVAEPGEILAIMGASGAGKTTLLNVLTQQNLSNLQLTGEVEINGEGVSKYDLKRMSAYVQQHDLFVGNLTVKEHLIFSAKLRMGSKYSNEQKMRRVEELIEKMGLTNCKDALIGQRFQKSISLGEKKRLAFASELITDPAIMFCDEPTSGLDAFMAKQVILALKKMADEGKTIVITIHQPSSQIFELFHKVCFMGMGKVIYFGPSTKVTKFFTNIGYPMADYTNPAEHAIQCLAIKEGEEKERCVKRVEEVAKAYEQSSLAEKYRDRINGPVSERRVKLGNHDVRSKPSYAAPWYIQLICLVKRAGLCLLRDPFILKLRLVQTAMTAIIVGIVYFRPELKKETILTYDGIMFNSVRDMNFMFLFPCILVFTEELPILMRETHAYVYRISIYFLAKNIAELPQYLLLPLVYSTIVYFMTGVMPITADKLLNFCLICIMMCNTATSVGYAVACILGTLDVAVQLLPLYTLPLFIFGGLFVNIATVPGWMSWLRYISWYRYAFESFMINLYHDQGTFPGCDINDNASTTCTTGTNGTSHLEYNGFQTEVSGVYWNVSIMLGMILFYRTVGMIALYIRSKFNDT
ncbi:unnamed protein product [Bursaphelenchus xylophilus]|uniref:(pine wood nematode) hypothetical protein n=1 Tax=Bursaphelenchus xylophilus TaxID=6326 RepID=A0A1I7SWX9_BURXY|nr:unnamed protein product [Bursaphelenchus xylophilus]CAG9100040.1 unnamed protein product [Bursaphelenchus xylophilus]